MAKAAWLTVKDESGNNVTGGTAGTKTLKIGSSTAHTGRLQRTSPFSLKPTAGGTQVNKTIPQLSSGDILLIADPSTVPGVGMNLLVQGVSNTQKLNATISGDGFTIGFLEISTDDGSTWDTITNNANIPNDPGAAAAYKFRVAVSVTPNTSPTSRSATLTVTPKPGTAVKKTITQTGIIHS
ncbi:MAG: hypothetical protein LBP72_01150 [Dysgonamonadaceae bacterium]|jgi:hypothetical protein|nr:hypothetical protein [Dysgonamonadaceae bacterium]